MQLGESSVAKGSTVKDFQKLAKEKLAWDQPDANLNDLIIDDDSQSLASGGGSKKRSPGGGGSKKRTPGGR